MSTSSSRLKTSRSLADQSEREHRFVRRLILERRIAYTKLSRHVRIAASDLDAFITVGRVEAGPYARLR
jgi:excisionase family DNA binding protein